MHQYHTKGSIREITVDEGKDSEGDPYFTTVVLFEDGTAITVAEGHFEDQCNQAGDSLKKALELK